MSTISLLRKLFVLYLLFSFNSFAATMTWLRPVSFGVQVDGVDIVGGPELAVMQFLAQRMPEFEHKFESYPLKRNWYLIQNASDSDNVYCFYGASKNPERQTWGTFSNPTSVLLPYPVVSLKGKLDVYEQQGYVSLASLFANNQKTVIFDGAVNVWTDAVQAYGTAGQSYLQFNIGHKNAEKLTTELLKNGRIDFAHIGSGSQEIKALEQNSGLQFSVYNIKEFDHAARHGQRVMCSRSPLGERAIASLNQAVMSILSTPASSNQFCELNFKAVGYHPDMQGVFNRHWPSLLTSQ